MLMLVHCLDRPDGGQLRLTTRPAHLEYMIAARDRLVFGGPLLGADGTAIGSAFVLRAGSVAEANAFLAADPYSRAGLFAQVSVHPIRQMVPEDPPGRLDHELALARAAVLSLPYA